MTSGSMRRILSNRNVLVTSLTSSLAMFFNSVYQPFWSLYLKDSLGMSIAQIGLLSMIQRSEQLLFQLPGGMLADRIGRKKVTLLGAGARIITPIILLFATSLETVALGTLISAMSSLSSPAFQALIAESLPREQMGSGYGVYVMIRRGPMLFTSLIGGILMDTMGVWAGTRAALVGAFACGVLSFVIRSRYLTETLTRSQSRRTSAIHDFKEVLPLFKGNLRGMQVTSCILQFTGGLAAQLIVIYVTETIGLSKTEWGFISFCMSVIGFLTSMPGGLIADKFNRVRLVALAEAVSVVTNVGYLALRSFWQILAARMVAGIGMGLSGATHLGVMGGPAWYSLMADFVPMEMRGRVNGLMATISGIVSLPAPMIGAWMWEEEWIGPERTLMFNIGMGIFSSAFFIAAVSDPKYQPQKRGEAT